MSRGTMIDELKWHAYAVPSTPVRRRAAGSHHHLRCFYDTADSLGTLKGLSLFFITSQ